MAEFASYTALQAQIASWLNREDLTAKIPAFIELFEAGVKRKLTVTDMVKRSTALTTDAFFPVPTDWRETIAVMRTSGVPLELEFVNIAESFAKRAELRGVTYDPTHYTQIDGKFYLIPAPASENGVELELVYRAKLVSLSGDQSSNWLLEKAPDLYLFGSLAEAEPYLKNDERVGLWKSKADEIIFDMNLESERAAYPQGKLNRKIRTFG